MTYEIPGRNRSYEAVVDMSGSFLKFVKLSGAGIVSAVTGTGDNAVGVLQNKPLSPGVGVYEGGNNNAATVMIDGVSRVVAGAAVAGGDLLSFDATGAVVPAGVGGKVVGVAESSASAAGELVSVLLSPLGGVAAPTA